MTILQNPPYSGNLHLKILQEAIKHADKTVNLSPVRWLQDPLSKLKSNTDIFKFEDSVAKNIVDLSIIDAVSAQGLFNSWQASDLALYYFERGKGGYDYTKLSYNPIVEKVWGKGVRMTKEYETKEPETEFACKMPYSHGHPGKKDFIDVISPDYSIACNREKSGLNNSFISFNTENERHNYFRSLFTKFMLYLSASTKLSLRRVLELPFMDEVVNPLTGKKGYESEWTDEAFYKYFNITEEEQKIIEEIMEKYK